MRNIHLIPTDKPSRLVKFKDETKLLLGSLPSIKGERFNVYITSNEEIKEGDWFLYQEKLLVKHDGSMNTILHCNKIIITDNEDLINDGVQPIDDEFLEWFVKNPSCKGIGIEEVYFHGSGYYKSSDLSERKKERYKFMKEYKIIIPH